MIRRLLVGVVVQDKSVLLVKADAAALYFSMWWLHFQENRTFLTACKVLKYKFAIALAPQGRNRCKVFDKAYLLKAPPQEYTYQISF